MNPWIQLAVTLAVFVGLGYLLTLGILRCDQRRHPFGGTLRGVRNLLLPVALLVAIEPLGARAFGWEEKGTAVKVLDTALWIVVIFVALSAVSATALTRRDGDHYQTKVPKLLVDILRLILVVIGAALVFQGVWGGDLGGLLTAIGVSSIVLGLALQNTLDNVMAGIAVMLERPFEVGDWIRVGDIVGEVIEMNWRTVRVCTRSQDMVVLPNSVVGKETLVNLSRPTRVHGESHLIGFSYDDAPNKVKRILHQVALSTRGVLAQPAIAVRTKNYAAYSIEYEVRFFIEDYARQQEINEEFMTKVWYAAKRNGLTIPFPIQTSFEFHAPMPEPRSPRVPAADALAKVPVFFPLAPEELQALSRDAVLQDYGRGERVVHQGDPGDSLFLIQDGTAVVSVRDEHGAEREVARLSRGEFFGEMAVLTGEPRTASVTAVEDMHVLVVHKSTLQEMFERRPALAQEMAEIMEARRQGLRAIQEMKIAPPEQRARIQQGAGELVRRIRHFFGL
ncbi:MAG: mechanosensitive ion channel family protein [Planctomycetota bacterium]